MSPNLSYIKQIAEIFSSTLEIDKPSTEKELCDCINRVKCKYKIVRGVSTISNFPSNYIIEAKRMIISNNFNYSVILPIVNIRCGYNPDTGEWDGLHEDCRLNVKR